MRFADDADSNPRAARTAVGMYCQRPRHHGKPRGGAQNDHEFKYCVFFHLDCNRAKPSRFSLAELYGQGLEALQVEVVAIFHAIGGEPKVRQAPQHRRKGNLRLEAGQRRAQAKVVT